MSKEENDDTPTPQGELTKIIPTREINELAKQRSDFQGFLQTFFHGGCISIGACLLQQSRGFYATNPKSSLAQVLMWLSSTLLGYFLSFLFMPLHETVHQTAFRTPVFNFILSYVVGFATMRPPMNYKYYHYAHHRFTGDPKKDPELSGSFLDPDIKTLGGYLFYLTGIPFWIDATISLFQHSFSGANDPFLRTRKSKKIVTWEARLFLLAYIVLAIVSYNNSSLFLVTYWVLPSFIGQGFLRFYLIAEHYGCHFSPNMISNTRTTETYLFYRRLAWNMPLHIEHHAWPQVPFYLLPDVHAKIKKMLGNLGSSECSPSGRSGYINIHLDIWKAFLSKSKNNKRN